MVAGYQRLEDRESEVGLIAIAVIMLVKEAIKIRANQSMP